MSDILELAISDTIIRQLENWFSTNCLHCPYYSGIANERVCVKNVQCLSDGAFKILKERSIKNGK